MGLNTLIERLSPREQEALVSTARHLTAEGKGIMAADESTGTVGKRLGKEKLDNSEVTNELLFGQPAS